MEATCQNYEVLVEDKRAGKTGGAGPSQWYETCQCVRRTVLGNMSLRMEDRENRLIPELVPINLTDWCGQLCKYPESHICINMT